MIMQGKAQRVTIYIGESDRHHGKPLYLALLEFLKKEGAMGATVTRGTAGFGAHSRIHTATIVSLSADLPVVVEWVDVVERVERLLPDVRAMVNDGLIVLETIDVVQYAAGRQPDPLAQPVSSVMRSGVTTVTPDAPVQQVVDLLITRGHRALPVVDEDRQVVGVITDGDLLRLSGLQARLSLQDSLSPEALRRQFAEIAAKADRAADIMSQPVRTIREDAPLREAADLLLQQDLKRLPVVDETGRFLGLISRVDVLRLIEYNQPIADAKGQPAPPTGATVTDLMEKNAPTARPNDDLETILQALERSRQRRVVVVDSENIPLGIITDGDILRRSQHGQEPGLIDRLRGLVTGESAPRAVLPEGDETAADLMTAPVTVVPQDISLYAALAIMLRDQIKRLPVVDEEGRLLGLLGRTSLLRGLVASEAPDLEKK